MRRNRELLPVRREQEGRLAPWSAGFFNPPTFFSASPWQVMRRMQEDMDRVFSQFVQPVAQEVQQSWAPRVDISQDDNEWLIEADLPGVGKDNIDVQVRDGYLQLRAELRQEQEERPQAQPRQGGGEQPQGNGHDQSQRAEGAGQEREYYRRERRYGYFERVLPLPENVDEEQIRCEFHDGVLKVHLPKTAEQKPLGRKIPIGEPAAQRSGHALAGETGRLSQPQSSEPAAGGARGTTATAGAKGGETSASSEGGDKQS